MALLLANGAAAEDTQASGPADAKPPASTSFDVRTGKPLDLLLTQAELRSIVRNYEIRTGQTLAAAIDDDDEVIVRAPAYLAPMRDVSQDVWGGVGAPFWAIMHPKDAWRILVPIPPRGNSPKKEEPPAPDPR